jgi:hypothetical protein
MLPYESSPFDMYIYEVLWDFYLVSNLFGDIFCISPNMPEYSIYS